MEILNRKLTVDEWVDYVAQYDFGRLPPDRLVLHHTWSPTVAQWRGARSMLGMKAFYEAKGWPAGPHVYAGPDGIWLFTPMSEVGVHANAGNANLEFQKTWNFKQLRWYSVGLEMVGDYDKARPAGPVWDNAKAVMGALCRRWGKKPADAISFHRDYNHDKTCPGTAVTKDWVWAEVQAWIAARELKPYEVKSCAPAKVFQGPGEAFPVAGELAADEKFDGKAVTPGWVWVGGGPKAGLGFVKNGDLK